jgi:ABC-type transport system involved in cytochrome bd biosynthesis fused ATPase/permease subunit
MRGDGELIFGWFTIMNSLGIIATLNLMIVIINVLESVASKFIGDQQMWEVIKKFIAIIMGFRDWLTQRKAEEQKKMDDQIAKQKQEIQEEYEDAAKRLKDAGYSGDAFESELDKLRNLQNSN